MKQDALGNSVRGARSFDHFKAGVNHADGTDAGQMSESFQRSAARIYILVVITPNQSQNRVWSERGHCKIERGKTRTACWFAVNKEYPRRLDNTRAPLDAAIFNFCHRGLLRYWSPMALELSQLRESHVW